MVSYHVGITFLPLIEYRLLATTDHCFDEIKILITTWAGSLIEPNINGIKSKLVIIKIST